METLALSKSSWLLAAIFAIVASLASPQKSHAATYTEVTCNSPVVVAWATGAGSTPKPQVTIDCTGGSSAGFEFFAFRYDINPNFANSIPTLVANWVLMNGTSSNIILYSNLEDVSGNAWGCGSANCRIINQVRGY
jgi:hypothetical protein